MTAIVDEVIDHDFEYPGLLERATITGAAASIEILAGRGFQLVAIPMRAPVQIGWAVLGFPVDVESARDLRQLTALDVSFFAEQPSGPALVQWMQQNDGVDRRDTAWSSGAAQRILG